MISISTIYERFLFVFSIKTQLIIIPIIELFFFMILQINSSFKDRITSHSIKTFSLIPKWLKLKHCVNHAFSIAIELKWNVTKCISNIVYYATYQFLLQLRQSFNFIWLHVIDGFITFDFQLNWTTWHNVIADQLLFQLMNLMNCILINVIGAIASFDSRLNGIWWCHFRF